MHRFTESERNHVREAFFGNLLLFLFGCGVLGFLVSIDRADWFTIRPASASSAAMSEAGSVPVEVEREARR